MSTEITLTPTSYTILGLLQAGGPATPYVLKQAIAGSVGNFWSLPHSQIYAEPQRLVRGGYVEEEREASGRRRRTYAITKKGRAALSAWLDDPDLEPPEMRDPALLKVFFGADPKAIAPSQIQRHRAKLAEYEGLHAELSRTAEAAGPVRTLEAGIAHTKVWIAYWERIGR